MTDGKAEMPAFWHPNVRDRGLRKLLEREPRAV
jgi:hypothetical protein